MFRVSQAYYNDNSQRTAMNVMNGQGGCCIIALKSGSMLMLHKHRSKVFSFIRWSPLKLNRSEGFIRRSIIFLRRPVAYFRLIFTAVFYSGMQKFGLRMFVNVNS